MARTQAVFIYRRWNGVITCNGWPVLILMDPLILPNLTQFVTLCMYRTVELNKEWNKLM